MRAQGTGRGAHAATARKAPEASPGPASLALRLKPRAPVYGVTEATVIPEPTAG